MITLNFNGVKETITTLQNVQKQVAFASSKAINRVAVEVQKAELSGELKNKLKLRGQWFKPGTKYGVNVRFASKVNLVATVGSQADWLKLVEHGGTKTPPKKALSVPSANLDTSRTRRKAEKPARLLASKKAFIVKTKGGKAAIFKRDGALIQPLYFFTPQAKVKDTLDFYEFGQSLVNRRYLPVFSEELNKAIQTAK